jgi:hypothetical protein
MIEFAPLLTLGVTHAYYGGRSGDFEYWMPRATERLLAGGRLLAKTREAQLTVLYEKGADGEPLRPLAGATLQIGLKLANPYFSNFTALPFVWGEGLPLYRNSGADSAALVEPVTLLLDPLRDPGDAELARAGLFCLTEIELEAGFYDTPPQFEIGFGAREETLKYYVVARNYSSGELTQLEVSDAGFSSDSRPQIEFTRVPESSFTAADLPAAALTAGAAGARVVLFRSDQPVARQEKARKRIQLARSTDVLIPHLPQPGAAAITADLVVHLSK